MHACDNAQTAQQITAVDSNKFITSVSSKDSTLPITSADYNNTKGFLENGQIITEFDCPDSRFFPPIDIKSWDKTLVVNGRLPTYEETKNGIAIAHYGEKASSNIKPYNIKLPKLASYYNQWNKTSEIVVVIQITQTPNDTVVGYRYLTGGVGGNKFSKFHFLTDEETKSVVNNKL